MSKKGQSTNKKGSAPKKAIDSKQILARYATSSIPAAKSVDPTINLKSLRDSLSVSLDGHLEQDILQYVLEEKQKLGIQSDSTSDESSKLTFKKLKSIYTSLQNLKFTRPQIEQGLSELAQNYTKIKDDSQFSYVLDYLCLHLPHDQLPTSFKDKNYYQHSDQDLTVVVASSSKPQVEKPKTIVEAPKIVVKKKESLSEKDKKDNARWILSYMENEEEEEEEEKLEEATLEELNKEFEELKLEAKKGGNKAENNQKIREAKARIDEFLKGNKVYKKKSEVKPAPKIEPVVEEVPTQVEKPPQKEEEEDSLTGGLDDWFQQAETSSGTSTISTSSVGSSSRSFLTEKWSGKFPKDVLAEWVRKAYSPSIQAPKYEQLSGAPQFKFKASVFKPRNQKEEFVTMETCPSKDEAINYVATLALYKLNKDKPIYQMLPPAYKSAWLEWLENDTQSELNAKKEEEDICNNFINTLLIDKKSASKAESVVAESSSNPYKSLVDEDDKIIPDTSHESLLRRQKILSNRVNNKDYLEMQEFRRNLPVFEHKRSIIESIKDNRVVIISGETGCGKTTQVPQYLVESQLLDGYLPFGQIICTQPRRISATSVARRVCTELGDNGPGTPNSLCGYQIRLESRVSRESTMLLYCTTGILIRKLRGDPLLKDIKYIIIDEVHERTMESDFILVIAKDLLLKRPEVRLIFMSATMEAEKLAKFFGGCPVISVPGRTFPVKELFLEDAIEGLQYTVEEGAEYARHYVSTKETRTTQAINVTGKGITVKLQLFSAVGGQQQKMIVEWDEEDIRESNEIEDYCDPEIYSDQTRSVVGRLDHYKINYDLIEKLITYICTENPYKTIEDKGAILVFLPGLSEIQTLFDILQALKNPNYLIIPLHSVLSDNQTYVFKEPPKGVRKIVLSTNIAETGVTIPDVVFVIDTGKVKETHYQPTKRMTCLQERFVSKASAQQRKGRAGRVREGFCFRMYTKSRFDTWASYSIPEMLRVSLEELCLHIKVCELGEPVDFLSKALDPPPSVSVEAAMETLFEVGAVDRNSLKVTPLGFHLSSLPVDVHVGKSLLFACMLSCLDPVLTIAAAVSFRSPFVTVVGKEKEAANQAKLAFATGNSDHLTIYKAYLAWKAAKKEGRSTENAFLRKNFMSQSTLNTIEEMKRDFFNLLTNSGFFSRNEIAKYEKNSSDENIIKAVLLAGLYPNLYQINESSLSNKETTYTNGKESALLHNTSINSLIPQTKLALLMYHSKMKSGANVIIRDSTMLSVHPVLLFGGKLAVQHELGTILIDNWLSCKAPPKTAVIVKEMRVIMDALLQKKIEKPHMDVSESFSKIMNFTKLFLASLNKQ